jgi:hypothetical protein
LLATLLGATWNRMRDSGIRALAGIIVLLTALAMAAGVTRFVLDLQEKNSQPESALLRFVAAHPQPGAVYIVPLKMQDFRLATGAAIYVDKESIPYRDTDVIEWDRRLDLAWGFYDSPSCWKTEAIFREEGVTRIVIEQDNDPEVHGCANLFRLYADDQYVLYEIRE